MKTFFLAPIVLVILTSGLAAQTVPTNGPTATGQSCPPSKTCATVTACYPANICQTIYIVIPPPVVQAAPSAIVLTGLPCDQYSLDGVAMLSCQAVLSGPTQGQISIAVILPANLIEVDSHGNSGVITIPAGSYVGSFYIKPAPAAPTAAVFPLFPPAAWTIQSPTLSPFYFVALGSHPDQIERQP